MHILFYASQVKFMYTLFLYAYILYKCLHAFILYKCLYAFILCKYYTNTMYLWFLTTYNFALLLLKIFLSYLSTKVCLSTCILPCSGNYCFQVKLRQVCFPINLISCLLNSKFFFSNFYYFNNFN